MVVSAQLENLSQIFINPIISQNWDLKNWNQPEKCIDQKTKTTRCFFVLLQTNSHLTTMFNSPNSIPSPTTPAPDLAGWKKRVEVYWTHPAPWLDHVFDSPTLALTRPQQELLPQDETGTFIRDFPQQKWVKIPPPKKKKHTKRRHRPWRIPVFLHLHHLKNLGVSFSTNFFWNLKRHCYPKQVSLKHLAEVKFSGTMGSTCRHNGLHKSA